MNKDELLKLKADEIWHKAQTKKKQADLKEQAAVKCSVSNQASRLFNESADLLDKSEVLREKANKLYAKISPTPPPVAFKKLKTS